MIFFLLAWALQPDPQALLALFRQAYEQRAKADPGGAQTARAASDLGLYLRSLDQRPEAAKYLEEALRLDERLLGPTHPQAIVDAENLAAVTPQPARTLELVRRVAAAQDPATSARGLARLAQLDAANASQYSMAAVEKERAASGREHPRVAARLNDLALVLPADKAEPLLREALAMQIALLGNDHPETATTLNNLGNVLLALGRPADAAGLLRRALRILETAVGPVHARTATACSNLADALRAAGQRNGAVELYRRALRIDERIYGAADPEVALDLRKLADAVTNPAEARRLRERAAKIERER